jgi:hypothetical protein
MAYSTSSAASCSAVLQALATFCTSYGWTVNFNGTYTGYVRWISVSKGSCYLNFAVPTGDGLIYVYGATGYNAANAPSAQPGTSLQYICNPGQTQSGVNPGPYTAYHFFSSTSGTYLHVAIEVSSGVFAQLHAGLNAVGGASPATYITVSNWSRYAVTSGSDNGPSNPDNNGANAKAFCAEYSSNSTNGAGAVGCTVDATFLWFPFQGGVSPGRMVAVGNAVAGSGWARYAHLRSPNTFNGVGILVPIAFFVERSAGNIYSMIGEAPDVRFFNMKNNNAKDEITIGSDVWKVFPIISNSPTITTGGAPVSSYPYGLAFKKSA